MSRKEENRIGLLGATSYIVGSIIGSGIFVSPKGILEHTKSVGLSLIVWVLCAAINAISALNYIELGTSIPQSGSEFAYISYVGWEPIAFSFLWLCAIIQSSCSGSVLFLTFGQYMIQAVEPLTCLSDFDKNIAIKLFGFGLILFLTVINMYSLNKLAAKVQILSMISKISAVGMIIGIGAYFMIFEGATKNFNKHQIFKGSNFSISQIVLSIYQGNWAYGGYTTLNYGTEEIEITNFSRTLPRAVLGGLFISSVIYVMANIAYFSVLSPEDIIQSDAVATLFLQRTVGNNFAYIMPVLVGFLIIGTLNGDIFSWSRYMLAGARKGMLPSAMGLIHPENDSPRVAIWTHTILCILFSFIGDVDQLVDYLTVIGIMSTICALLALILIKIKGIPVASSAVKFSLVYPIIGLIIQVFLLVTPIVIDPITSSVGIGLFLIGVASYYVLIYPKKKLSILKTADEYSTRLCQLIFWCILDLDPKQRKSSETTKAEETHEEESETYIERF
ncbi:unnamed protein product [Auanema sp. JU1783]|nr:unnamed protein product [Auanema sp. JU1783]